ncbi:MAG TPA: hypothetical protein PLN21_02375 [Gemmatales bacterium]|nr:hypothetical protein [Gemmatales bacterium]
MPNDLLEDSQLPFEDVKRLIENYRLELWHRWFRFHSLGSFQLQLRDIQNNINGTDGFHFPTHITYFFIDEWDLEKTNILPFATNEARLRHERITETYPLSGWQKVIIEELCHEFQHDVLHNKADDYGNFLFDHYGPLNTPHQRHTAAFTTAVAKFALMFNYDIHILIRSMWTHLQKSSPPVQDHWKSYVSGHNISQLDIELPARIRWENGDQHDGHDLEDWLLTEQELKARLNVPVP